MKNRMFFKGLCVLCSGYIIFPSLANATMYDLNKAASIKTWAPSQQLIQVASFRNLIYAQKYQRLIKSYTAYPVHLVHKKGYYKIIIGPLHTAHDIRKAAQHIMHGLNQARVPDKGLLKPAAPHMSSPLKKQKTMVAMKLSAASGNQDSFLLQPRTKNSSWYITAGAGAQFPQSTSDMTVNNGSGFSPPYNVDIYSTSGHENTAVFLLSAGRRFERENKWFPAYSIGLYYQYLFSNTIHGTITQYSEPQFKNYSYQWSSSSNVLLASAKLNITQINKISPYMTGGLGGAFNRAGTYTESAFSGVTPRISPDFSSHSHSQFAYQAGAGLDYNLSKPWLISLGYLYQNIGHITSGRGTGNDWYATSLNLGSAGQNEVVASISYLFK